jgi:hypothetical protein
LAPSHPLAVARRAAPGCPAPTAFAPPALPTAAAIEGAPRQSPLGVVAAAAILRPPWGRIGARPIQPSAVLIQVLAAARWPVVVVRQAIRSGPVLRRVVHLDVPAMVSSSDPRLDLHHDAWWWWWPSPLSEVDDQLGVAVLMPHLIPVKS